MFSRRREQLIAETYAHPVVRVRSSTIVAFAFLFGFIGTAAHAVGLGDARIQSAIGQPLRVNIPLLGSDAKNVIPSCFKSRLLTPDGSFIVAPSVSLAHAAQSSAITVSTSQRINEPAVTLLVELDCGMHIQRDYVVLLDPPGLALPVIATQQVTSEPIPEIIPGRGRPAVASTTNARDSSASQTTPRRTRASNARPAANDAQGAAPKTKSATPQSPAKPVEEGARSVLRLSSSADGESFDGLKLALSTRLSNPDAGGNLEVRESVRIAQAKLAAILNDDESTIPVVLQAAEKQLQAMQAKVQALETENARLKKSVVPDRAALNTSKRDWGNITSLAGLGLLLLASAAAVIWLIARIRKIARNSAWPGWSKPQWFDKEEHDTSAPMTGSEPGFAYPNATEQHAENFLEDREQQAAATAAVAAADAVAEDMGLNRVRDIPKVEEILDAMQQAEFWMSLNNMQMAIKVLELYVYGLVDRPGSPVPWLLLFDLYRDLGYREKYDALRERFHILFNSKIPEWHAEVAVDHSRGMEDMPHLLAKVSDYWNTEDIVPFLENLLIDDRGGKREGFDLSVYRDILLLIDIAYETQRSKGYIKPDLQLPGLTLTS
jgi:pilus assembly protein FimV